MKRVMSKLVIVTILAAATLVVAGLPAGANHCDTGRFCAFDLQSFGHPQLVSSAAAAGTDTVDVADNQTSSAKNRTDNRWCGVESNGWPDQTIFRFAPHTWYETLGTAGNDIDHFYVKSSGNQCD